MSDWFRDAFDEFYLTLYSHRNQEEAARFVKVLGKLISLDNLHLLDVCCGEGRFLRAFGEAGVVGFGLDLSEALLRRLVAAHPASAGRVVRGDMREFSFRTRSFDVCINMFTSFGYFQTLEEELRVIREAHRVLRPGGLFVIDHANPVWVKENLEPRSVREVGDFLVEEKRRILDGGKAVEKTVVIRSAEAPSAVLREYRERVSLFPRYELEKMLEQAGYTVFRLLGTYDGDSFDEPTSCRLIALARTV